MVNNLTEIEHTLARIEYWLESFGMSVDTLDHALEDLQDLGDELKEGTADFETISTYLYSASSRIKCTKKQLKADVKTIKDSLSNFRSIALSTNVDSCASTSPDFK